MTRRKCDFVADDDFDDDDVGGGDGDKGRVNGRLVVDAGLESS